MLELLSHPSLRIRRPSLRTRRRTRRQSPSGNDTDFDSSIGIPHTYSQLNSSHEFPITPPGPPRTDPSSGFALLATLQISVRATSRPQIHAAAAAAAATGCRDSMLRKQGRLALTFALKAHAAIPPAERIDLANRIEEEINRGTRFDDYGREWEGGEREREYRDRVYFVGGLLARDEDEGGRLVGGLVAGWVGVEEVVWGVGAEDGKVVKI